MITTLQNFLRELTFIQIPDIKRHAKGLLTALEKSNRKEMLDYLVKPPLDDNEIIHGEEVYQKPPFNSRS